MKRHLAQFSLLLLLTVLSSCAKIYYSPDAYSLAQSHQMIAVLPPTVSIAASKKIDAESLKEQQKTESLNFQKEMLGCLKEKCKVRLSKKY